MSRYSKNRTGKAPESAAEDEAARADGAETERDHESETSSGTEAAAAESVTASVEQDGAQPEEAQEKEPEGSEIALANAGSSEEDEEDYESEDSLTFSNGVIEKIVAIAMRDVPGVLGMKGGWINRVQETFGVNDSRKGVVVEVTPDSAVKVNISVLIEYGAYAPQVFEDVKKTVVKQVTGMTGLRVAGVNLRIEDVLTPEEYAAGRKAEKDADAALAQQAADPDGGDGDSAEDGANVADASGEEA